jgi:outer membrane protein
MGARRGLAALLLAAAAGPALPADLLSVYRDAMLSDPVYQSSRAQYNATIEALPQARAGYLPLVSAVASVFHIDVNREIAPDQHYNTTTYGLTLSQPIFRMQNWIAIDQAQQQVLQAGSVLASAQQDLALRAAQAYFDVLLAEDNVALSAAQKTAISEQLAQAKRNFEVGTATIVDTLEAQARFDQAVAKEISDQSDLEVKQRTLQQLLGKPPEKLTPVREPMDLANPKPQDIEAWVRTAADSSFTVAIARANYEIAQQEISRQRAGHLPTLDLSGSLTQGYNPQLAVPQALGPNSLQTAVGVTLSIPIFSGGLVQSHVRQAVALRDRAEQDLENAQRSVALAVRTAYLNVTSGISQVRALEQALVSTQSQLDSTILGRDVGVRTSVDVLNAQQQVFQTRRDLQQARYNYLVSTLRLKSATGQLSDTDMEKVNAALAR